MLVFLQYAQHIADQLLMKMVFKFERLATEEKKSLRLMPYAE
jgi:hypothetical protein